MDSYEATKTVFSRLQSLDPEYASKTMGYILLQDEGEKEMIRLAFGTENQLLTVINKAKTELPNLSNGSSSTSAVSTAVAPHPSFSSLSNPIPISRPTPLSLPLSSPRLTNAGLFNPPSPSSPSLWSMAPAGSNHHGHGQTHLFSPPSGNPSSMSYAAAVNGNSNNGTHNGRPFSLGFGSTRENFVDDYHLRDQSFNFVNDPLTLQSPKDVDYFDQSSLDFVPSPSCRSDSVLYPYLENNTNGVENHGGNFHRRSCSVNDVCFGMEDSSSPGATGFKSCLYYNRGFCKNGSSCKFVHGGGDSCGDGSTPPIGSPYKFDAFDQCQQELIRSKIALQQRLAAAQLMGGMNLPYNKLNFLQSEAAQRSAMLMGEDFQKLSRSSCRSPRNEFSGFGGGDDSGSSSRQIYLTFPADSTFREEDVSNYFSNYGPVQDVRIPYQQKRMFGFVTFHYPETVRRILAKGNPHFVCDSRVLVKPYKEKSKLPDKKQQQQNMERGEFSSCTSPSGLDLREPFEIQIGPRMLYNTQEMLYRKKLEEQADLQQALELQGRRMQLLELKNQHHLQQNMHVGSPLSSPHISHAALSQTAPGPQSNGFIQDNNASSEEGKKEHAVIEKDVKKEAVNAVAAVTERNGSSGDNGGANDGSKKEEYDLGESFEHILPDNLFASPTKSGGENRAVFSSAALVEAVDVAAATSSAAANIDLPLVTTATMTSGGLGMATPLKSSCFLEMPRFSSGHGAVGM